MFIFKNISIAKRVEATIPSFQRVILKKHSIYCFIVNLSKIQEVFYCQNMSFHCFPQCSVTQVSSRMEREQVKIVKYCFFSSFQNPYLISISSTTDHRFLKQGGQSFYNIERCNIHIFERKQHFSQLEDLPQLFQYLIKSVYTFYPLLIKKQDVKQFVYV